MVLLSYPWLYFQLLPFLKYVHIYRAGMTSRFVDSVDSKKNNAKFKIKLTNYILFSLIILPVVCFVEFFFFSFLVSSGITRFLFWKTMNRAHCYAAVVIFMTIFLHACAENRQCKRLRSIYGSLLKGHVFQEHNAANILACSLLCHSNIRCQSVNYVMSRQLCELNNRTKESRPEDFVQDPARVYMTRPSERGIKYMTKFVTTKKPQLNDGAVKKDILRLFDCQNALKFY